MGAKRPGGIGTGGAGIVTAGRCGGGAGACVTRAAAVREAVRAGAVRAEAVCGLAVRRLDGARRLPLSLRAAAPEGSVGSASVDWWPEPSSSKSGEPMSGSPRTEPKGSSPRPMSEGSQPVGASDTASSASSAPPEPPVRATAASGPRRPEPAEAPPIRLTQARSSGEQPGLSAMTPRRSGRLPASTMSRPAPALGSRASWRSGSSGVRDTASGSAGPGAAWATAVMARASHVTLHHVPDPRPSGRAPTTTYPSGVFDTPTP